MPPLIPRSLSTQARRCQACARYASIGRRPISSSPVSSQVPPESPNFIEVPKPPQPRAPYHPPIKGTLPRPRSIFGPPGSETNKATPEYLDAVTQEPKIGPGATHHDEGSREAWKQRMASARRRNLREGVVELYERRMRTQKMLTARNQRKQAERQQLLEKPQREDERLTNPSVISTLKDVNFSVVPDPNREARVERQRQRMEQRAMSKAEERRDALHTLYMQATDFITTEENLNDAIEQAFGTPEAPARWGDNGKGDSIWYNGKPNSVQDMLNKVNRTGDLAMDAHEGHAALTQQRIKRIAEELTGGKI